MISVCVASLKTTKGYSWGGVAEFSSILRLEVKNPIVGTTYQCKVDGTYIVWYTLPVAESGIESRGRQPGMLSHNIVKTLIPPTGSTRCDFVYC